MEIRPARDEEVAAVMTVFGSRLAVSADRVRAGIAAGRVLVAVEDGPALGAILLEAADPVAATPIEAIAVRPGRRGQGIGSALVRAAAGRHGRLVAGFDPAVRPFWASLGFEIRRGQEADRLVGHLDPSGRTGHSSDAR